MDDKLETTLSKLAMAIAFIILFFAGLTILESV